MKFPESLFRKAFSGNISALRGPIQLLIDAAGGAGRWSCSSAIRLSHLQIRATKRGSEPAVEPAQLAVERPVERRSADRSDDDWPRTLPFPPWRTASAGRAKLILPPSGSTTTWSGGSPAIDFSVWAGGRSTRLVESLNSGCASPKLRPAGKSLICRR